MLTPAPVAPLAPTTGTQFPAPFANLPGPLSVLEKSAVNFLIGAFPVPPFLLPIYQAAGIDYGVPWQALAAINEIETDYGRNLSVSSAGAEGWMQFMPSTWARFGMDADGNGRANPYDPVDAIFAAARYLHAAGAERSLRTAIFAYNHADWYVNSVELRAQVLQYLPQGLVDGLTGLMQASYPAAGRLGRYANVAPVATRVGRRPAVVLSAPARAPVIAVADGTVVGLGKNAQLGRYVTLADSYGNRFTYSRLGSRQTVYPVVKPSRESALKLARRLNSGSLPSHKASLPAATGVAPAGSAASTGSTAGAPAAKSKAARTSASPRTVTTSVPLVAQLPKERLFVDPSRPASYEAGGYLQLESSLSSYAIATNLEIGGRGRADYFSQPVRLRTGEFALAPLARGSVVVAGTVLGRVAASRRGSPGFAFEITPAGARAPVDPSAIVAGWRLLGRLTAGRSALVGSGQAGAFGAGNPTLGQLMLGSKLELERSVLSDPRVAITRCDQREIQAGRVDRRVLAVIEYLSYSGFAPTVSQLACWRTAGFAAAPGTQIDISALGGIPVAAHQQEGGIVDLAIRRLLALQGALRPSRVISLRSYAWQPTALALPDHSAQIEIDFSPSTSAATRAPGAQLDNGQWNRLIGRVGQLSGQPTAPASTSTGAAQGP